MAKGRLVMHLGHVWSKKIESIDNHLSKDMTLGIVHIKKTIEMEI